eukprot:15326765-Ditylum_brightwellii.AAC.1
MPATGTLQLFITAPPNRVTFKACTSHLVRATLCDTHCDPEVHKTTMELGSLDGKKQKGGRYGEIQKEVESEYTIDRHHSIERADHALNQ